MPEISCKHNLLFAIMLIGVMLFQPMLASAKCGGVDYSWGADALSNAHDFTVTMMLLCSLSGVCHSSHRSHHRSFTNLYKDEYGRR